jgi:UrcA family protein
MKTILPITATALFALAGGAACAQPETPPTATVRYADLDLSSAAGRHTLERRIDSAISRVCPDEPTHDLDLLLRARECRDHAWAEARRQLAADVGTARYAEAVVAMGPRRR